ncbi:MAG: sigma-70 family RNA polymerase sigma factor [Myxococcales bacterium]|nr:sigma-70 family RNA polymerase sigma factor [Myxococcales bacterium]
MSRPPSRPAGPDGDAFEEAYRRHAPGAFVRARRILGDESDAREVVHDVFVGLLERPAQYRGHSALGTFLYSAVTHACLNHLRNRRRRLRLLAERFLPPSAAPHGEAPVETAAVLRATLRRMPPPLGEVAVYCYLDGLSHAEVAELIGCSRRQVSNHLAAIERWASREELRSCRT